MDAQRITTMLEHLTNPPRALVWQADIDTWRATMRETWNRELAPFGLELQEGCDDRGEGQGWFFVGLKGE